MGRLIALYLAVGLVLGLFAYANRRVRSETPGSGMDPLLFWLRWLFWPIVVYSTLRKRT